MLGNNYIQERINKPRPKPLTTLSVVIIRIAYDAITFLLAAGALFVAQTRNFTFMGVSTNVLYAVVSALILAGSVSAFFLIRSGKTKLGLNVLIYSLIIGTFINSIYMQRVGSIGIVSTIFFTILAISHGFEFRKGILPMAVAMVFGLAGLTFDTLFESGAYRTRPVFGFPSVWIPTVIFCLIVLYVIGRQFPSFSLRAKLITSIVVITILSLVLLAFFNMITLQSTLTQEADADLITAATQVSTSLNARMERDITTVETLAGLPAIAQFAINPDPDQLESIEGLLNILKANINFYSYTFVDSSGTVVAASDSAAVGTTNEELGAIFANSSAVEAYYSDVIHYLSDNTPILDIYSPILGTDGSILGVLRVQLNAYFLQELIEENNSLVSDLSFAVLFDQNNIQIANGSNANLSFSAIVPLDDRLIEELRTNNQLPYQAEAAPSLNMLDLQMNLSFMEESKSDVSTFNCIDFNVPGEINRVAVVRVPGTSWTLGFFQPRQEFLEPISSIGDISIFTLVVSGLFATIIGMFLTQAITRPISNLKETASSITGGDFSARVEVTSQDEIGELGNTFNMMAIQLQNLFGNLEKEVAERTKILDNQTAQMKAITEITRDVTAEEEMDYLLDRTSFLLYDRFGYAHVGIYLTDPRRQFAVLASSQDPKGRQLLANGHRYKIEPSSNVGLVCAIGKARKVSSVDDKNNLQYHPLLTNTQAQITLPLRASGKVIGAIDIHSQNPRAFSEDEIDILNTFTDQIAIAIEKIQYREEIQNTLQELESAYGQFTQESWRRFIQGKEETASGFRYNQMAIEPVTQPPSEVAKAWEVGEIISQQEPDGTTSMVIPMKVRGEVISVLKVNFDAEVVPVDTQNLITEIADRLSLVMENARLIETAQKQVEQEQMASYLTDRIRGSLDLDTVLRTAAQEIGDTLGLAEVEVRLGSMELGMAVSDSGNGSSSPPRNVPPVIDEDDYEPTN